MSGGEERSLRERYFGRPWLVLVAASVGLFLVVVDSTIVNISIPAMITGLHTDLAHVEWVLNAYTLVFASLLIPLGRAGDMRGRKRIFLFGLVVFGAASAACGLAPTIGWLIAARVVQAVGAAAMMPATLSLVRVTFPPERRGLAFGIWAAISGFGIGIGPTLGGLLTQVDWRLIFFVNVPIVVLAVVYTTVIVPESRDSECHTIDRIGAALWVAALGLFNFAIIQGPELGWSWETIGSVLGALVLFVIFFAWEKRAREPMMDLPLLRRAAFSAGNVATIALLFGMVGGFFLIPLFLQDGLGYSALETGLTLAPIALVLMTVGPIAGRLSDRFPPRIFVIAGMLCVTAGLLWVSTISIADTPWTLLPRFLVMGFGAGLAISPMTSAVMSTVPADYAGSASGTLSTSQRLGAVLGVAVLGAVLQLTLAGALTAGLSKVPGLDAAAVHSLVTADAASSSGLVGGASSLEASLRSAGLTPAQVARVRPRAHAIANAALVEAMAVALRVGAVVVFIGAAIASFVRPGEGASAATEPGAGAG